MQFTAGAHAGVADGSISVTFRRWQRSQVKVGGRYRVGAVFVEVDTIELVPFAAITPAEARRSGSPDREGLRVLAAHSGPIDDDTLLHRIEFHVVGPRETPPSRPVDAETIAATVAKLDRMDARSEHGPWTRRVLTLIGDLPGIVSTELAAAVARPRPEFKQDVRKLKRLGLTESLEVGYRLTPLGEAIAAAAAH